jgi:hypothetical protein
MRIPFSKVYRAFPELDEFSDAECQGFVQLAQRERAAGLLGTAMGAVVASLASGIFVGYIAWLALAAIFGVPEDRPTGDVLFGVFFSVIGISGVTSAALVGLLIRDLWIRWAITRRLRIARCLKCSYSLLGLSVIDGRVQCHECGDSTRLSDRGLTPADILAGARELILRDGVA